MKKLLLFLSLVLTATIVSAQTIRKGDANNDKKINRLANGRGIFRWIYKILG